MRWEQWCIVALAWAAILAVDTATVLAVVLVLREAIA